MVLWRLKGSGGSEPWLLLKVAAMGSVDMALCIAGFSHPDFHTLDPTGAPQEAGGSGIGCDHAAYCYVSGSAFCILPDTHLRRAAKVA